MIKIRRGAVTILTFVTLFNSAQSYRSTFYDSSTYPQNRENWQRSDEVQPEQNGRYYNAESNTRPQTQGGTNDWSTTAATEVSGMIRDDFRASDRPEFREQNLRGGTYSQTEPHHHHHFHYRNPPPQGPAYQDTTSQDTRRSDEGLIFKVQRNSAGKLNVVFNDTVISQSRPQGGTGLENRAGQIPFVTPVPNNSPARDIIFPGDERHRPQTQTQQMSPPCPGTNKMFCTKVDNYPRDIVERVLNAEAVKYEQLFGDDILPDQAPNITQRIDAPGEESLCMSTAKIIYPQAGLTKDNNWSFIVNQPNYTQGVRIEECLNPGKPCAMTDNFPNTYTTECRQKFIYRQLVGVNAEGKVAKDLFQLPSCCICILKSMNRFRREAPSGI